MLSGFIRYVEQHIISPYLAPFISAFANAVVSGGGKVLTDAATAAVAAAETNGGSNSEKFAAALAAVEATVKSEGLPFLENAARLAIEAAVAKQHATQ